MKLHHIGIAVENIERYYNDFLKPVFGYNNLSPASIVEMQHSRIAFAENGQSVKLELIEYIGDKSPTYSIIKSRSGGLYHIGYVSDNFEEDLALLRTKRFRLISCKEGVAFLMSPSFELYELLDRSVGWD